MPIVQQAELSLTLENASHRIPAISRGVRFSRERRRPMQCLRLAFVALAAACLLNSQDFRAHIQGVVSDSSSAGIPGATVELLNINTGVRAMATTNETGAYRFDYVDSGTYTLTVEHSGFAKFAQEKFPVQAGG